MLYDPIDPLYSANFGNRSVPQSPHYSARGLGELAIALQFDRMATRAGCAPALSPTVSGVGGSGSRPRAQMSPPPARPSSPPLGVGNEPSVGFMLWQVVAMPMGHGRRGLYVGSSVVVAEIRGWCGHCGWVGGTRRQRESLTRRTRVFFVVRPSVPGRPMQAGGGGGGGWVHWVRFRGKRDCRGQPMRRDRAGVLGRRL
jgi:hypothetical protein